MSRKRLITVAAAGSTFAAAAIASAAGLGPVRMNDDKEEPRQRPQPPHVRTGPPNTGYWTKERMRRAKPPSMKAGERPNPPHRPGPQPSGPPGSGGGGPPKA